VLPRKPLGARWECWVGRSESLAQAMVLIRAWTGLDSSHLVRERRNCFSKEAHSLLAQMGGE
jgi:hypothetical protein